MIEYSGIRPWWHAPTCGTRGAIELSQQFCELHSSQLRLQGGAKVSASTKWTTQSVPLCAPYGVCTRGAVQVGILNNTALCRVEFGARVAWGSPGAKRHGANRCESGRRRPIGT